MGGVLCTGPGDWIADFLSHLGVADNLQAELVAILHGLKLAWACECLEVVLYSDLTAAIWLVEQSCLPSHHYASIVLQIKDFL